jgi:hypothetical protein
MDDKTVVEIYERIERMGVSQHLGDRLLYEDAKRRQDVRNNQLRQEALSSRLNDFR